MVVLWCKLNLPQPAKPQGLGAGLKSSGGPDARQKYNEAEGFILSDSQATLRALKCYCS